MKIRFWGVRGSFAMPGPEFLRYGGNTSAVEVVNDAEQRLLIDLGTGATELAKELMATEFGRGEGSLPILLSHTHLDHIQGLPFFTPFYIKGNEIRIIGHEPQRSSLTETLQNQLNGHYSPVYGLENLAAGVSVETVTPGDDIALDGFAVKTAALPHWEMWTMSFRITADDTTIVYMSDVEYPERDPLPEALELARGADLLIHDAMFSDVDYVGRRGWGHSSVATAIAVAEQAGVARLALFHHNPDATDAAIDAMIAEATKRTEIPVFAAAEGRYLEL